MVVDVVEQRDVRDDSLDDILSVDEFASLDSVVSRLSADEQAHIGFNSCDDDDEFTFDAFRVRGHDGMSGESIEFTPADKAKAKRKVASHMALVDDSIKEQVDKIMLAEARAERVKEKVKRCHEHVTFGACPNGHRYAKELYSGFEFCPICGADGSSAHGRKIARWLPKMFQIDSMGLFVIEHSLVNRDKYRTRAALEASGRLTTEVLSGNWEVKQRRARGEMLRRGEVAEIKAGWYARALRRKHFFGDIPKVAEAESKICGSADFGMIEALVMLDFGIPASSQKSNIHENVIVDGAFILPQRLEYIKSCLREAFKEPDLIVHYGYTNEASRKWHALVYVTRATFLDIDWDKHLAAEMVGFRNMRSWGKWDGAPVWSLSELKGEDKSEADELNVEAINQLGQSLCPKDGLPIKWGKPRLMTELKAEIDAGGTVDYGGGYHELRSIRPCGHVLDNEPCADKLRGAKDRARARRGSIHYEYSVAYGSTVAVNEHGVIIEVLDEYERGELGW